MLTSTGLGGRRAAGLVLLFVFTLLLGATAAAGARPAAAAPPAARAGLAETPPPGPLLATGPHTQPEVGLLLGVWEAFPAENVLGHVLYIWDGADWVSRAYPCP